MVVPYPEIYRLAWFFPIGFIGYLFPSDWNLDATQVAFMGWLFYIALTFIAVYQDRRVRYFAVYSILCVLLALNVVGCHVQIHNFRM